MYARYASVFQFPGLRCTPFHAYFTGGGIVADSVPYNEYMESANKAKAVMNAIERASEVDG